MAEYRSFDGHGVDVAVNRVDDLDKKALVYIADHPDCQVLDLGSGAGGQSLRMVQAGARVLAVDQFDFTAAFAALRLTHSVSESQLRYVQGDIRNLPSLLNQERIDVVVMQRTLHYLRYQEAHELLQYLGTMTDGMLYISVTGSSSLVRDTYPCVNDPISDRYCQLTQSGQDAFLIHESVCLYSQTELQTLLVDTGWEVVDSWVSAFGNIKAVCKPTT